MIHTDEDDEFERIAHEAKLKGQPYYFQPHPTDPEKVIFRKPLRQYDDDDIQEYVRPWAGLTDEDIASIDWESLVTKKDCVQAIEAKLREKNR